MTVEKMDRCSCVGVGKDAGQNSLTWNVHDWHLGENWFQEHQQISSELWETQLLSTKFLVHGSAWTFSCTVSVDQLWDDSEDLVVNKRQIQGSRKGPQTAQCNWIPISPLLYIVADPLFTFAGKKGSCVLISPNCQQKLEFPAETLAPWLCVASCVRRSCAGMRISKKPWLRWHIFKL